MLVHVSGVGSHWKLEDIVMHGSHGIAKDIAECIDGLANCDDEAHDAESGLDTGCTDLRRIQAAGSLEQMPT